MIKVSVLYPAGADTKTSRGRDPSSIRSDAVSRGRATSSRRGNGTWSFDPRITPAWPVLMVER